MQLNSNDHLEALSPIKRYLFHSYVSFQLCGAITSFGKKNFPSGLFLCVCMCILHVLKVGREGRLHLILKPHLIIIFKSSNYEYIMFQ